MGTDELVRIDVGVARQLAFYTTGQGFGVVAPRGWYCFGIYGSSGVDLVAGPRPIKAGDLFRPNRGGIAGPVVELEDTKAGGSGTAIAAEVWARIFPSYWPIVKGLISNGDLPAERHTFGPYHDDKLSAQTARLVRFQTRPRSEGLGTMGHLKADDDPIEGVAMLQGKNPDLVMLRVRLPRELCDLAPRIIQDLLVRQRSNAR
jgi:hypothetical protein